MKIFDTPDITLTSKSGLLYINGELADGHYKYSNGLEQWFKEGLVHRTDGPAIIYPHGRKEWLQNGKLYRENDLPHVEHNDRNEWHHNNRYYFTFDAYLLAKVMG